MLIVFILSLIIGLAGVTVAAVVGAIIAAVCLLLSLFDGAGFLVVLGVLALIGLVILI